MKKTMPCTLYADIQKLNLFVGDECKVLYKGKDLAEFDLIYPRINPSLADFGYITVRMFEDSVYTPISSDAIRASHDKFLTLEVLARAGLPIPKTILTIGREKMNKVFEQIGFPMVLKLLSASGGKGVLMASDIKEAKGIADTLHWFKQPVFVEEFIENPGEDIRLFVIGDEVAGAMKRVASKSDFRSNIHAGGKGERYVATPEEKELAIKASQAIGADIAGVDILHSQNGPFIIETNIFPGLKGIMEATKKDIPKLIAGFLHDKIKA
ncbi:MAG: RimK family alpha-L-glutamate ligase [Candidatus Altiarchaeota archaeon]|nr:RimK family alpha-L-glutamate ligase [Candidatus Altiarchaeota archaeon]